jgi:hypothetical protein
VQLLKLLVSNLPFLCPVFFCVPFSLGLAYAGTANEQVLEILTPLLVDGGQSIELVAIAGLSLGFIFCGTANEGLSGSMIEVLLTRAGPCA